MAVWSSAEAAAQWCRRHVDLCRTASCICMD
ncbi:putative leader peptide [Rhodococcus sp. NPDC060086]